MSRDELAFWLTAISTACGLLCFWWRYRISAGQDALLAELREQASRIERLAQAEHDLIREVHPQVGQIKDAVDEVASRVNAEAGN
jgi:hypothetical protein